MPEAYVVEYYRKGRRIVSNTWPVPLEITKRIALDDMVRYGADFVRIMNSDLKGPEIWSEAREA
jgi:hypothetical protein